MSNNEHLVQVNNEFLEQINIIRKKRGFLTIEELLRLQDTGNVLMDPFSTLISKGVAIGEKNVFYPNVVLEAKENGKISLGDTNTFFLNTYIAAEFGNIVIGSGNQFGEGGCTIKVNQEKTTLTIGDNGRYINGPLIVGETFLGAGTQVIGPITVQNCRLEAGGSFKESDPDSRGAVLKGAGLARGIVLPRGRVINAYGLFQNAPVELQSVYHPK